MENKNQGIIPSSGKVDTARYELKQTATPGKSYKGESSASFEKLEKPVWRGRQLKKFRKMLFTIM